MEESNICACCQQKIDANNQSNSKSSFPLLCDGCAVLLNIPHKEPASSESPSAQLDCSYKRSKKRLCPSCMEKTANPVTVKTRYEKIYSPSPLPEDVAANEETDNSDLKEGFNSLKAVITSPECPPNLDPEIPTFKSKIEIIEGALLRSTLPTHLHKKAEEHLSTNSWVVQMSRLPLTTVLKTFSSKEIVKKDCTYIFKNTNKPVSFFNGGVKYRSIGINTDETMDLLQRNILLERQIAELKRQLEGQISLPAKKTLVNRMAPMTAIPSSQLCLPSSSKKKYDNLSKASSESKGRLLKKRPRCDLFGPSGSSSDEDSTVKSSRFNSHFKNISDSWEKFQKKKTQVREELDYDGDVDMGEHLKNISQSKVSSLNLEEEKSRKKKTDHSRDSKRRKVEKRIGKEQGREEEKSKKKEKQGPKLPTRSLVHPVVTSKEKDEDAVNNLEKKENEKSQPVFGRPAIRLPLTRIPKLAKAKANPMQSSVGLPALLQQNLERNVSKAQVASSSCSQLPIEPIQSLANTIPPFSAYIAPLAEKTSQSCASTLAPTFLVPKPNSSLLSVEDLNQSLQQSVPNPAFNKNGSITFSYNRYKPAPSARIQTVVPPTQSTVNTKSSHEIDQDRVRSSQTSNCAPKSIINILGLRKKHKRSVKFSSEPNIRQFETTESILDASTEQSQLPSYRNCQDISPPLTHSSPEIRFESCNAFSLSARPNKNQENEERRPVALMEEKITEHLPAITNSVQYQDSELEDISSDAISSDNEENAYFSNDENTTRSKSPRKDWKFGSDYNPDSSEESDNDEFFSIRKSPNRISNPSPLSNDLELNDSDASSSSPRSEAVISAPSGIVAANEEGSVSSSDEGEYLDLVIDEQDVIDCPDVASTEKVACVTSVQISMPKELPTQSRSVILPVSSNPTPSTSNIHLVEGKIPKPCFTYVSTGKCQAAKSHRCVYNHNFNAGTIIQTLIEYLNQNNVPGVVQLIRVLANAKGTSPFYNWLAQPASNNFVEAVKNASLEQKREIFFRMGKQGRKKVAQFYAERMGMSEFFLRPEKQFPVIATKGIVPMNVSDQTMGSPGTIQFAPKPAAVPQQAPVKLLNRVTPTIRSPLMTNHTQPTNPGLLTAPSRIELNSAATPIYLPTVLSSSSNPTQYDWSVPSSSSTARMEPNDMGQADDLRGNPSRNEPEALPEQSTVSAVRETLRNAFRAQDFHQVSSMLLELYDGKEDQDSVLMGLIDCLKNEDLTNLDDSHLLTIHEKITKVLDSCFPEDVSLDSLTQMKREAVMSLIRHTLSYLKEKDCENVVEPSPFLKDAVDLLTTLIYFDIPVDETFATDPKLLLYAAYCVIDIDPSGMQLGEFYQRINTTFFALAEFHRAVSNNEVEVDRSMVDDEYTIAQRAIELKQHTMARIPEFEENIVLGALNEYLEKSQPNQQKFALALEEEA